VTHRAALTLGWTLRRTASRLEGMECRVPLPVGKFPRLLTKRLVLRCPTAKDACAFQKLLSIPEVTQFSNWPDQPTQTQSERSIRRMAKLYSSGEGCGWIIEDQKSKSLIGAIRYNSFEKKWKSGELGYELHPDFWGKGLMSEAVAGVVECGHEKFGLNRIEAWTLPGNPSSDRVLEKAGFRHEGTLRQKAWFKGRYHDFRVFGRIAGDPVSKS
jgi:ribosomal-protein-alanine N-acetyltransferase